MPASKSNLIMPVTVVGDFILFNMEFDDVQVQFEVLSYPNN